jgi:glycosyltransferase involved in cell wall biosynthesis
VIGDERSHNHRLLLTAFGMHRAAHRGCALRFVCAGALGHGLEDVRCAAEHLGIADSFDFVEASDSTRIAELVRHCQALVVPSLYETVGDAVLEAMILGRPVVHARIADLVELRGTADGSFDPHKPAELVALFERIEREPDMLVDLAQRGQRRVAEIDEPEDCARVFVDAILDAASAGA